MVFYNFKFPAIMSFVHQTFTTTFSFLENIFCGYDKEKDESSQGFKSFVYVVLLSFLFSFNIVTGNLSLFYCSVAFVQVMKAIVPIITMILSFFIMHERYSLETIICCFVICAGVAAMCFGEINLTVIGFCITLINCFLSSFKKIFMKLVLNNMNPSKLLIEIAPFSSLEIFTIGLCRKEHIKMINSKNYKAETFCIIGVIFSGIIAYFLNITNFWATHYTSPLTMTIAGCLKQMMTILISFVLFNSKLTYLNGIGIFVTTVGSFWYSMIEMKKKPKTSNAEDKSLGDNSKTFKEVDDVIPLDKTKDVESDQSMYSSKDVLETRPDTKFEPV